MKTLTSILISICIIVSCILLSEGEPGNEATVYMPMKLAAMSATRQSLSPSTVPEYTKWLAIIMNSDSNAKRSNVQAKLHASICPVSDLAGQGLACITVAAEQTRCHRKFCRSDNSYFL